MAYVLQALIGEADTVMRAADALARPAVALPQGYAMVLTPGALGDDDGSVAFVSADGEQRLAADVERAAVTASAAGSIAYVDAEFFGGVGTQASAVWAEGSLVAGPLTSSHSGGAAAGRDAAVNVALRALGVAASDGDEFDALGLGGHTS